MELGPKQLRWVEALESGKYEQGEGRLRKSDKQFCCLGVVCDLLAPEDWAYDLTFGWRQTESSCQLPAFVVTSIRAKSDGGAFDYREDAGAWIRENEPDASSCGSLAGFNDVGVSFKKIAEFIRKFPELIFSEPA